MQDSLEPIFKEERKGGDNSIKTEKLLSTILAYWPVLAVCVVVTMLAAYIYLRYTTPRYMSYAKVLIKDEKKSGSMGEGQLLQELGLQTTAANIENEVEIFKSRTLMKKVVDELQLNIHYYAPGRIKTSEYYYTDLPFRFVPLFDNGNVPLRYKYQIKINGDKGFTITDKKNSWSGAWGDTVNLPIGPVVIKDRRKLANPSYELDECSIEIKATEYQAIKTLRQLDVDPVNKASILQLSVSDVLPERGEDILNELIEAYLQANIDDRNKTLDATVEFIDERLKGVTYELSGIEKNIEQFKSSRKLTDLSEQSKMLLNYTSEYARQLTDKEVKLSVVESLEQYLNDERNRERIVPSSLLVEDDAAMNAMKSYNDLQLKRAALLMTSTEDNPFVVNLDKQLENIREDMIRSLAAMKQAIQVSIKELESRAGFVDAQIRQVPEEERIYLEYSRQQNIKQELYLFLLKKREESAISKSSTVANARIVDPAKSDTVPYSPKPMRIYLAAFALGLILPGLWIFIKEVFNVKISGKEDIRNLTAMGIIAEIGHSDTGDEIVVSKESKTVVAEQFRALRTNMQFLLAGEDEKVILLTSSMSGEGKSFVALNLAVTLALSGERVALLELDLRKPKISEALDLKNSKGFTQYIIGQAELSEIIQPAGVASSLYVVPSGAVPPNPSELLSSKKLNDLFNTLKKEYDYIVVDSAPVGLVTDAQLLSKYSDTVLYVCRMNYTFKEQLRNADELMRTGKMQKMNLVVNDMKAKGGVYGYGYGSYGADYFEDGNKDKGVIGKLKNKLNKKA
jgi:capsular exopolysaccharide synthesis family protein